jgi:hypothetical protein
MPLSEHAFNVTDPIKAFDDVGAEVEPLPMKPA